MNIKFDNSCRKATTIFSGLVFLVGMPDFVRWIVSWGNWKRRCNRELSLFANRA